MSTTTGISTFRAHLGTPSDLAEDRRQIIGKTLLTLTADVVALYFKTKNYHWHMSGSHFKEYHELLDEQADQIFAEIVNNFEAIYTRKLVNRSFLSHQAATALPSEPSGRLM